jgi:hypothetical protein
MRLFINSVACDGVGDEAGLCVEEQAVRWRQSGTVEGMEQNTDF